MKIHRNDDEVTAVGDIAVGTSVLPLPFFFS